MAKKKVLTGAERKAQLLDAGAKLASKHGAQNVTRRMVATAAKCAEALVTVYMGDTASAQKAYAKQAKKLGLTLPTKEQAEALGVKLRAHGPRKTKVVRKRSVKEVKAIKEKSAGKKVASRLGPVKAKKSAASAAKSGRRSAKPAKTAPRTKRSSASDAVDTATIAKAASLPSLPPLKKTAARKPKNPPTNPLPALPPLSAGSNLPPLP